MRDYLIDTNIIPCYLEMKNGCISPECLKLQSKIKGLQTSSKIFLSVITKGEIEYGLNISPTPNAEQHQLIRYTVNQFPILDINPYVTETYGILRGRLFDKYAPKDKKGKSKKNRVEEWINPTTSKELQVQENDVWLCAVAMTYNLIFVTHDKMNPLKDIAGNDITFEDWLT
ncbi:MAG: hypothetical protein HY960_05645 [Ignavibacteriae bacterium]|nr:hypothetical protein [Ignavibacteriota bacterium]